MKKFYIPVRSYYSEEKFQSEIIQMFGHTISEAIENYSKPFDFCFVRYRILKGTNFSNKSLFGARFLRSDLSSCNFLNTYFLDTEMYKVKIYGADFRGASFPDKCQQGWEVYGTTVEVFRLMRFL